MNRSMSMPITIFMTSYYPNSKQYSRTSAANIFKYQSLLAGLLLWMLMMSSCSEKATIIGTGLLPSGDFVDIQSTDTIAVQSYTDRVDSTLTSNLTYSYLGGLYDPYFGNMSADFVSQLRLLGPWPGGGAFTVDSVKLSFTIIGAKGLLPTDLLFRIFEIDEELFSDSSYYSNRSPNAGLELCSFPLPSITNDTVQTFTVSLPVSFGEYLTRDTTKLFQASDTADFQSFFKGIYFTAEEQTKSGKGVNKGPMLLGLAFKTGDFLLTVYYHNESNSFLFYDFVINENSVRYNRYSFDLSTAEPGKMIQHINDGFRDTLSYLQGFGGVFTRLELPGLAAFKNFTHISVNKARLMMPVLLDGDIFNSTTMPSGIYIKYEDSDGVKYMVPDYSFSPDFFGGTYNASSNQFTFNLAIFVQEYLEGNIAEPVLEMFLPDGEYKNVIFRANSASVDPVLDFVYTLY